MANLTAIELWYNWKLQLNEAGIPGNLELLPYADLESQLMDHVKVGLINFSKKILLEEKLPDWARRGKWIKPDNAIKNIYNVKTKQNV
jgi:hypothetical protein